MDVQPAAPRPSAYAFLTFTVDLAAERLIGAAGEIKLRPKSFQVLRYLLEHRGRLVTRDELLQAIWPDVAVTDESLTKCVGDIRKALTDDAQAIVRTVTRRGFVFQADVHEASVAQSDPCSAPHAGPRAAAGYNRADGHPLPHGAPELPRPKTEPGFPLGRTAVFAATLVAIVAGLVWVQWGSPPSGRPGAFEAIAVLPFESLSADADQQYIADGTTEALITNLGRASSLRVIARTSVGRYRGTTKPVREIARELNVDVVVEGTVTQSGDRLRVTANLIQVSPEKHIWAGSYERSFRDVIALQNEIAGAIAGAIQEKLTPRQQSRLASSRPVNPEAQLAYWKAQSLMNSRYRANAAEDLLKTINYAEQALRLDPAYAPAHAALARTYPSLSDLRQDLPRDAMPRARLSAQRAIALDEDLSEAHVALGWVLLTYEWDWAGAEREARRAIASNRSDAQGYWLLANYLAAIGRVEEAVFEMKRARELDPLAFRMNWHVGRMLYLARHYDEALTELTQAGDMQPNAPVVDLWSSKTYWQKGLNDEAIATDLRVRRDRDGLNADLLAALQAAYSSGGSRAYWTTLVEAVRPIFRSDPVGWYRLAEISASLGDNDEAFQWLERAYVERASWMTWINVDPSLDPLRADPRFSGLLRRMQLAP